MEYIDAWCPKAGVVPTAANLQCDSQVIIQ